MAVMIGVMMNSMDYLGFKTDHSLGSSVQYVCLNLCLLCCPSRY